MLKQKKDLDNIVQPCILIVNVHSTRNAGDAALLLMNIQQLCIGFDHPRFLVSANYGEEPLYAEIPNLKVVPSPFRLVGASRGTSVISQILRLLFGAVLAVLFRLLPAHFLARPSKSGWMQMFNAYRQADLVVAVSGNQFLSMGKYGWPFPLTSFPVWMAHLNKKPFYVLPQSIGPFKRNWEKWIIKSLYGRARLIFLRDEVSLELSREIGLPQSKVRFAPDPAFALKAATRTEAIQILSRYGFQLNQPAIGVTVIAPLARTLDQRALQHYYQDLGAVLERFSKTVNARIYLFNQVTGPTPRENDRLAGTKLLSLMHNISSQTVIVEEELTPAQLKACYGCMDLMIASRLHSGIFAMGAGTATLLIGYFTKSRGLMRAMGFEDWLLEIGNADADVIWQKLTAAWPQRQALAEAMQNKSSQYAGEVLLLGKHIREDFDHG